MDEIVRQMSPSAIGAAVGCSDLKCAGEQMAADSGWNESRWTDHSRRFLVLMMSSTFTDTMHHERCASSGLRLRYACDSALR
jgi:hypothetical protein